MKILLIDTTTFFATVAIIDNNKVVYKFHEEITSDMSSKIVPIIDEAFNNVDFNIEDIDKIMVCNGPGSFTGIRVGVTVAKTIAWALKKDIIPLSSLELMATTQTSKNYLVPMIDARRKNAFIGIYDRDLNCISLDKLTNVLNFVSNLNDDYEFVSYDNIEDIEVVKPNIDLLKIVSKHINDGGINPHNLNPNYLKLTEAEENKLKND